MMTEFKTDFYRLFLKYKFQEFTFLYSVGVLSGVTATQGIAICTSSRNLRQVVGLPVGHSL